MANSITLLEQCNYSYLNRAYDILAESCLMLNEAESIKAMTGVKVSKNMSTEDAKKLAGKLKQANPQACKTVSSQEANKMAKELLEKHSNKVSEAEARSTFEKVQIILGAISVASAPIIWVACICALIRDKEGFNRKLDSLLNMEKTEMVENVRKVGFWTILAIASFGILALPAAIAIIYNVIMLFINIVKTDDKKSESVELGTTGQKVFMEDVCFALEDLGALNEGTNLMTPIYLLKEVYTGNSAKRLAQLEDSFNKMKSKGDKKRLLGRIRRSIAVANQALDPSITGQLNKYAQTGVLGLVLKNLSSVKAKTKKYIADLQALEKKVLDKKVSDKDLVESSILDMFN